MKKVLIIGSGPAGITAGIYLSRAKIANTIITNPQGSLKKAMTIENYYGLKEPIKGEELFQDGIKQYLNLGGQIIEDEIVGIGYDNSLYVKGLKKDYSGTIVILATGVSRLLPNIKGLNNEIGVSFCATCDAFFYRNKNVVVLGNSNYAVSEANVLNKLVEEITIFTDGREMECDCNYKINNKKILSIQKNDNNYSIFLQDNTIINTDGIFIAEGIAGAVALAKKIGAKIENNYIVVDRNMRTNIPNLYAVGDCIGGTLQIVKASCDGMTAALDIIKIFNSKKDDE